MWLSDVSVKRPVFATVLTVLLFAFGILSFKELPVREYPDIASPIVSVSTQYAGASAEVVEKRITQILESELSGIQGVKTINSNSRDGRSSISIEFDLDRDIDVAANDVRDRVSRVVRRLPDEVDPPTVDKRETDARPIMYLTLSSDSMNSMEITDYADRYVVDRFATIPGVSNVSNFGSGRPSMRLWIDRLALAARQLTVSDIEAALLRENIELPAGRVESLDREFQVRMARNYTTPEDFERLVIKRGEDGHLVRLGEVAEVEIAPRNLRRLFRSNGADGTALGIIKQSTANTVDVLSAVNAEMAQINQELPEGMRLTKSTDDSVFIRAAIRSVYWTIGITVALVGCVIFLFLGNLRATIIPVLTIPICLVAAFSLLAAFGLSVNLITLLALVLCIGLVVDDSIVVLENCHRRVDKGEAPLLAAYRGSRQVSFAVITTTVVLVAVFAPIVFLKDNIGRIFSELAITISAAVIFSTFLALSLVPMLCSKLLKPHGDMTGISAWIDRMFERLAAGYQRLLERSLKVAWAFVVGIFAVGLSVVWLLETIPQEYAPQEDQGFFFGSIRAPEGTSLKRMFSHIDAIEAPMLEYVESGDVQRGLVSMPGWRSGATNSGIVAVTMALDGGGTGVTTREAMNDMLAQWRQIPDLNIFAFMRSGISRGGGGQPVQFVLGGPTYEELARWRDIILEKARENPGLVRLDADLKETQPQLMVRLDKDRAAELGVSVRSVGRTLQTMMTEQELTTYVVDGEEYDVILQAKESQRATPEDLRNIYVRSDTSGDLIPLTNVIAIEGTAGSAQLNRYNRMRAVTLSASLAPGYSLSEALDYLEGLVRSELPVGAKVDYKGESLEYKEASGAIYFSLGMALLVVFLVLAAQFESFRQPIVIMITVPLAVAGGLLGLLVTGLTFNIYSQIGIIMLVGIAAKNGILIVEFINQLRDAGRPFEQAIVEASRIRFRPVLMTTVSTTMGSIPLMLAAGPGAESRTVLGVVVFFGIGIATVFTLFIVPSFYKLMARGSQSPDVVAKELEAMRAANPNVVIDKPRA
ncbi:MAG: efflux RND transporter permease subunit [Xanthomonadales bacterium]|nr:efflux RND transporter permease subunit [Xanthomonadales bacterium]